MPSTMEASLLDSLGRIILLMPLAFASTAIGSPPRTERSLPSRASSPRRIVSANKSCLTIPSDASMPTAIGKSKELPSFLISAGARLIVIRVRGKAYPQFLIAASTLSRDSLTALSGSPTIVNAGTCFSL